MTGHRVNPSEQSLFQRRFTFLCCALFLLVLLNWLSALPAFKATAVSAERVLLDKAIIANKLDGSLPENLQKQKHVVQLSPTLSRYKLALNSSNWRQPAVETYLFRAGLHQLAQADSAGEQSRTVFHLNWQDESNKTQYASITRANEFWGDIKVDTIVRLPGHVDEVGLTLRVKRNEIWQLSSVSLQAVEIGNHYYLAVAVLVGAWLAWAYAFVKLLWHYGARKVILMMLVLVPVIILGGVASSSNLQSLFMPLLSHLLEPAQGGSARLFVHFMSFSHFIAFFILALLLSPLWLSNLITLAWFCFFILLVGLATESLQAHIIGRSSQLSDLLVDMYGLLLALVLVVPIKLIALARRRTHASAGPSS